MFLSCTFLLFMCFIVSSSPWGCAWFWLGFIDGFRKWRWPRGDFYQRGTLLIIYVILSQCHFFNYEYYSLLLDCLFEFVINYFLINLTGSFPTIRNSGWLVQPSALQAKRWSWIVPCTLAHVSVLSWCHRRPCQDVLHLPSPCIIHRSPWIFETVASSHYRHEGQPWGHWTYLNIFVHNAYHLNHLYELFKAIKTVMWSFIVFPMHSFIHSFQSSLLVMCSLIIVIDKKYQCTILWRYCYECGWRFLQGPKFD